MAEIKPCPYCGATPKPREVLDPRFIRPMWKITCTECLILPKLIHTAPTEELAIEMWNKGKLYCEIKKTRNRVRRFFKWNRRDDNG
jgi:hypothetical protein